MKQWTKQDLYAAYEKHDRMGLSAMHEPGTDPECAVCDEINTITAALEGVTVAEAARAAREEAKPLPEPEPEPPKPPKAKPPVQHRTPRMTPVIYDVVIAGKKCLYRVTTRAQVRRLKAQADGRVLYPVAPAVYNTTYLMNARNAAVSIASFLKNHPKASGRIAEMQLRTIRSAGQSGRQAGQKDQWLHYSGENQQAVIDFVAPCQAHPTKKGNKVQIVTSRGSFSLAPGDYAVKLPTGRILNFDEAEFEALYTITASVSWTMVGE
ncbi:hypothetical protein FMM01_11860 [Schleiferilactobacillus harbinensis]|uniref:hypothetical protein n=1 Tax=Schleiferilactobacillus harbinensis TaxID=304207 RepID=UPI00123B3E8C|nr:hypothetical protein [Schleiferilactobacillus harbinensis]QEU47944.1 hypothetical protein FMM01_11860 [Schleiferilactobacillus harbinensis]